jgi:hypothetical protein
MPAPDPTGNPFPPKPGPVTCEAPITDPPPQPDDLADKDETE